MESIETLIPDNEGNHLVVVLNFYEDYQKTETFHIPSDFINLEIADIAIEKLRLDYPLGIKAFNKMCEWLIEQFTQFPNAVFSFICSTDTLDTNHNNIAPESYRWNLFEFFFKRNIVKLQKLEIQSQDLVVGPEGYQTFARIFYRPSQASIIHLVIDHLENKYL